MADEGEPDAPADVPADADRRAEAEVLAAARERAAALATGDVPGLERLLHPLFTWTSHVGDRFARRAYIERNTAGPVQWHGQRLEDVDVTVVGATAVLSATVVDDVTTPAGRAEFRMPVTQTWVHTPGGWQCLAGHAGPRLDG
ncbi:nuclear transport factor 2 family protein [Microbacterium sp. NPDC057407]|uniref:nuclear transport factor 2 family protein n=1 Tax=Microbacterium sp. NPDC057407 TaxID=3346120 RepID=UPI00366AEBAD